MGVSVKVLCTWGWPGSGCHRDPQALHWHLLPPWHEKRGSSDAADAGLKGPIQGATVV